MPLPILRFRQSAKRRRRYLGCCQGRISAGPLRRRPRRLGPHGCHRRPRPRKAAYVPRTVREDVAVHRNSPAARCPRQHLSRYSSSEGPVRLTRCVSTESPANSGTLTKPSSSSLKACWLSSAHNWYLSSFYCCPFEQPKVVSPNINRARFVAVISSPS